MGDSIHSIGTKIPPRQRAKYTHVPFEKPKRLSEGIDRLPVAVLARKGITLIACTGDLRHFLSDFANLVEVCHGFLLDPTRGSSLDSNRYIRKGLGYRHLVTFDAFRRQNYPRHLTMPRLKFRPLGSFGLLLCERPFR